MNNEELPDLFEGYGVSVNLKSEFGKIREVLTRIGIASLSSKKLVQTCHIFHKRGQYVIMHFKELFLFDGKSADFTDTDESRRNRIVKILEDWGLVEINEEFAIEEFPLAPIESISVIQRKKVIEDGWTLESKYTIGKKVK